MASSSVSQESLDHEDYEITARRNRHIRPIRTRAGVPSSRGLAGAAGAAAGGDTCAAGTGIAPLATQEGGSPIHIHPAHGSSGGMLHTHTPHTHGQEHESPTRSATQARLKEKRSRPNHLHKGKTAKDKRKLREKRRSTGVVRGLPSTEVRIYLVYF